MYVSAVGTDAVPSADLPCLHTRTRERSDRGRDTSGLGLKPMYQDLLLCRRKDMNRAKPFASKIFALLPFFCLGPASGGSRVGLSCQERRGPSFCVSIVAWQPTGRLRAPLFLYMCSILRQDCGEHHPCEYMPRIAASCFRLALLCSEAITRMWSSTILPRVLHLLLAS